MIGIYCYLKREKYKVLKFGVKNSANFENKHLLLPSSTLQ